MANLEDAVFDVLDNHAGLSNLVSSRIYPVKLPQGATLPAVTYTVISAVRESAFGADTGDAHDRVQFDAWAADHDSARNVKEEIRSAVQRHSGTNAGVVIDDVFVLNERSLFEDDTEIWHLQLDAMIHYQE